MRDINRIDAFCAKLAEIWKKVPDLRFFQLMAIVTEKNDLFYTEDDQALTMIAALVDKISLKHDEKDTVIEKMQDDIKKMKIDIQKIIENQKEGK